jgi:hypothetical protein
MEQPSSSCCPKSSWLPDPRFLISVISGEVLISRSRRQPRSPESPLLAFWGWDYARSRRFRRSWVLPLPRYRSTRIPKDLCWVIPESFQIGAGLQRSVLVSHRFQVSSVALRVLCGKRFLGFPACFLPPPGLFFSRIQNKALIRFHPCETQAWPLGDAWVTQGSPLGHPNPIPNPIPIGRGSQGADAMA